MEFILLQKKDYNVIKYSFYLHVFIKNTRYSIQGQN